MKGRLILGFAGMLMMGLGFIILLDGKLHYQNYWHGLVFAPFALVVGALALLVVIKGTRF
jgi:hypothetical protein